MSRHITAYAYKDPQHIVFFAIRIALQRFQFITIYSSASYSTPSFRTSSFLLCSDISNWKTGVLETHQGKGQLSLVGHHAMPFNDHALHSQSSEVLVYLLSSKWACYGIIESAVIQFFSGGSYSFPRPSTLPHSASNCKERSNGQTLTNITACTNAAINNKIGKSSILTWYYDTTITSAFLQTSTQPCWCSCAAFFFGCARRYLFCYSIALFDTEFLRLQAATYTF